MLTLPTTAKSLQVHSGVIQQNIFLHVGMSILDYEENATKIWSELDLRHEPLERSDSGMKYEHQIFAHARAIAERNFLQ